jgi:hypothetical protein
MGLSFWTNVFLGVIVTACGAMSSINLIFAIPATIAGVILLWGNITTHKAKQADFKKRIVDEALGIADHIVTYTDFSRILYPDWSSENEESRSDLLSFDDYNLCKQFYHAVEARNGSVKLSAHG